MKAWWLGLSRRYRLAVVLSAGVIAAVVGLIVSVTVVAPKNHRPAAAPSSTKPLPSSDPRAQAVVRDYQAYWNVFLKAADPANPTSSDLAAHATGEELRRAQAALTARQRAGEAVRGRYEHRTGEVFVTNDQATLSDCLTPYTAVYDAAKGKVKSRDPEQAQPLEVMLKLEGGKWKVALIKPMQAGTARCTQ
jgi:hypothetical protein